MYRIYRQPPIFLAVFLVLLVLTACGGQSTPPAGHSIYGSLDGRAGYLLLHWPEGLRIMIWDDLPHGAHHNGSSSSTGDPVFHMDGGAKGPDGQGYDYVLESAGGIDGSFSIDDIPYDLDQGKLFFIRTGGGDTQVEQLEVDLSNVSASNAGIEAFGRRLPQIIAFVDENDPLPIETSTEAPAPSAAVVPPPASRVTTTGIIAVDQTVAAILSNDYDAREELIRFSTAGCTTITGLGGPPKCASGQAEGTPVEYFPVRRIPGEGQPIPPEEIDGPLSFEVTDLYTIYSQSPESRFDDYSLAGEYGLIFETPEQRGYELFVLVHIDAQGQIVQIDFLGCPADYEGNLFQADILNCAPQSFIERDASEVLVQAPYQSVAPSAVIEPPEVLVTVPRRMTPTPAPVVTGSRPQLTRPLYFLTSELPISSVRGDGHGLWVLEPGSPAVKKITPEDQHVTAVDIQQAGGRIVYGTGDGAIFLLEPDNQARLIYTHPAGEQGEQPSIGSLSWSPDGEWLAFTAAYQDSALDSSAGGLWLLGVKDESVIHLINNRHLQPGETEVSAVRQIIDVDYSPDGSALLLQASFWEYMDILWLWPLGASPAENNIHDSERLWRDGAWTADGRSILLSGWDMAAYSDLALVDVESGLLTRLVDGEAAGLLISKAQELPVGIAFLGAGTDPDSGATRTNLYLANQTAGGESMLTPVGPDHDLCFGSYVMDIAWEPVGSQAIVSCVDGAELISLDGSIYADLTPILESIPGDNSFAVMWGYR